MFCKKETNFLFGNEISECGMWNGSKTDGGSGVWGWGSRDYIYIIHNMYLILIAEKLKVLFTCLVIVSGFKGYRFIQIYIKVLKAI